MPKPTYIFDFDSTLVTVESIDELARIALKDKSNSSKIIEEFELITSLGMTGEIELDESLKRRLKLFNSNHHQVEEVATFLKNKISPSVRANSDWFRENAESIYVVSSGFIDYILPVTRQLGLPDAHIFANKFSYNENGNITGYDHTNFLSETHGKVKQVEALHLAGQVIVVGDGYTDYEIKAKGAADVFCVYIETITRPNVVALADKVLDHFEPFGPTDFK